MEIENGGGVLAESPEIERLLVENSKLKYQITHLKRVCNISHCGITGMLVISMAFCFSALCHNVSQGWKFICLANFNTKFLKTSYHKSLNTSRALIQAGPRIQAGGLTWLYALKRSRASNTSRVSKLDQLMSLLSKHLCILSIEQNTRPGPAISMLQCGCTVLIQAGTRIEARPRLYTWIWLEYTNRSPGLLFKDLRYSTFIN